MLGMQLQAYLTAKKISAHAFAKLVNKHHTTIYRILSGEIEPSPALAREIERVTSGKVTLKDQYAQTGDA